MRFFYRYQDRAKGIVEGEVAAASQSDAYSALRKSGIRPMQVWPAPGLANRLASLGKRGWSIVVLCALCLVLGALYLHLSRQQLTTNNQQLTTNAPRHQIYGDPVIMDEITAGLRPVVSNDVERFLMAYAIPGRAVPYTKPPKDVAPERDLAPTPVMPDDLREVREYRQIINGMKEEVRAYLEGGGTWGDYVRELRTRQDGEVQILERTRTELANETDLRVYETRNAELRALGLPSIPRPKEK